MKYLVEKNTNIIVYNGEIVMNKDNVYVDGCIDVNYDLNTAFIIEADDVNHFVGGAYKYENGSLIVVNEDLLKEPVIEEKIIVPQIITPRQFRLQLLSQNLLDEVEAIAAVDKATQIWFEYSLDFQRNHEMLLASAGALGMSDADIDTFFIEASKL